ncbi:cytochrome b [Thiomicrorhabdus sp. zzn3]|uniref:cytochrome b n=1 Tax=Thiomicrorhabdus sp. zzn3 TaxID=3039775 RepID=UPI00243719A2|nr:cytochrome b [Thiomicrorhabdus sp. zzn3]MDG6778380.1 cytochrome b [Thiomicrorhabdus sp. zzn3]
MKWTNSAQGYGWVSIGFHWLLAVAILGLFALGVWMVELDYYSTWYHQAPEIHKSVGVLVMMAMIIRWGWNLAGGSPAPLVHQTGRVSAHWQRRAIKAVHWLLYLWVLALGVSGYLISTAEGHAVSVFGWFDVPVWIAPFDNQADLAGEVHEWLAYSLMGLVTLHLVGALKHHFINQDNTLKRMLLARQST